MNRLFYTIFSNIDIFKVIKNTFIFVSECVAMNLLFLGLACFANPDIIDKNLLTELSFKNSYAFFDRKITYIRGSTIEHMKKVKELCIGFNCEVKVLTGDSDYKVRLLGIILMVLVCLAVLFCTCVIILIMYGYLYFMLGILLY